jgi:hypothetical protein
MHPSSTNIILCISFREYVLLISFPFLIAQVVAFLGVLIYKFYGDELREMFGYEEHPYGFYTMAGIPIYSPLSNSCPMFVCSFSTHF